MAYRFRCIKHKHDRYLYYANTPVSMGGGYQFTRGNQHFLTNDILSGWLVVTNVNCRIDV